MKKIMMLLAGFLAVSCSNDDIVSSAPQKKLSSIKMNYYQNDKLMTFRNFTFLNDQLVTIKYQESAREDYTYNIQGLVSQILIYNLSGRLITTITYSYDTAGRITEKSFKTFVTDTGEPVNVNFVFTHLADKIVVAKTYNGDIQNEEILMNSNKKIIKQVLKPDIHSATFQYENDNVTSSKTFIFNLESTESYSYNTLKNDYNYRKYIFGNEWKLNDYLDTFDNGSTYFVYLQSENLISEYTSSPSRIDNSSNKTAVYKRIFTYNFNDQKQIYKETEIYSRIVDGTTENIGKSEFIYTYK
ncbi:hypothetical protein IR010_03485 [Flavobacterium sp. MR2016-29]|uniref:hypothetical protein n=1 Tax=Flavobacterium sp. MR2016-29 TaxID=2783795 RepID=UPI00188AFD7A|nr:hypothetical protein [Flavobacterium sp. MR2016-29]MBF4491590.1 hypothetical protein [Flavobacterium sp. MR2016-29]